MSQVLVNFLEVEDIGQGSCAGRIAQETSVLVTMRSMLEELPCCRDSRDVLENMLKIIWVVVRRDRRSVLQALPAGVLFSALKRLKDIIHKNSVNEVLSTCAVLLGEGNSGPDLDTCQCFEKLNLMVFFFITLNFIQATKFQFCANFSKETNPKLFHSLLLAHPPSSANC